MGAGQQITSQEYCQQIMRNTLDGQVLGAKKQNMFWGMLNKTPQEILGGIDEETGVYSSRKIRLSASSCWQNRCRPANSDEMVENLWFRSNVEVYFFG